MTVSLLNYTQNQESEMASKSSLLLGPPEIYEEKSSSTSSPVISDPFMDLMVSKFNSSASMMGFTENLSVTFLSSGNPCLDFFFHVVPDTASSTLTGRLEAAWDFDPLTTLKLICNLRGVRGTGKSDKEGYYTAALWLHKNHPKTLACNLDSFADFGYFKDLPEILHRLLDNANVRQEERRRKGGKRVSRNWGRGRGKGMKKKIVQRDDGSKITREEKKILKARKAVDRYNRDSDYRFLFDKVSDVFANFLKSDIELLKSGELGKISLAAKWCPSLDSSFDRSTLLCESIARRVFPKESDPEYEVIEDAHYAYRVRDRLRKQVLVPLRKALELPEVYIGANDWGSIPYNRVASVAMKNYKDKFLKHDKERFQEYLAKVRSGNAKIAAGALLPHEIVASLDDDEGGREVGELQWERMVHDMAMKGKLRNCLAICDVSGSMFGLPMEVSVALGVLVSELSEEPWKGKLITFSANPKLQMVMGKNLKSKTDFVRNMEWGMNTNFQKVFDLILQVAEQGNLKPDQMIKKLFVFSDMEFDQASETPWETDYQAIVRKFREKGYDNCMPEIIFWNLRESRSTPVQGNQKGVALVSGFSKNLLTLFLEDNGIPSPEAVMEAAISGEEYKKLAVVD